MIDFNLIISTGRDFETQAECEAWFNLLSIGDPNAIIQKSGIPGLILAKTDKDPRDLVYFLQKGFVENPSYVQFIKKIYPIDGVVETNLDLIKEKAIELLNNRTKLDIEPKPFRISVRKRQTTLKTSEIIPIIADEIKNPVSLQDYHYNIQIEIIGDVSGIAILEENDIFSPESQNFLKSEQKEEFDANFT